MLERDGTYNDVIDRIERLEARVEDIRDVARPSEVIIYENPEWQALAGWVSTGSVLRSLDGEIILDPTIPMIQVGTGGYIQSEDFVAGTSGFQINGGTAEFNDVVVRGTIYADLGEIGGWVIGANTLTADAGAVGLNSEATGGVDWRIWAGNAVPANAPFRVDESGNLVATSATITGTITATSGTIGGWTINAASLTGGAAISARSTVVRIRLRIDAGSAAGDLACRACANAVLATASSRAALADPAIRATELAAGPRLTGIPITAARARGASAAPGSRR